MDDELELGDALDGAAGPENPYDAAGDLRAIVARARRRTVRAGAALGAVILVAGGLGGYLFAGGQPAPTTVHSAGGTAPRGTTAGPASSGPAAGGSTSGGSAQPVPGHASGILPAPDRRLFVRTTAAGVTVRGFAAPCQDCIPKRPTAYYLAEVSTGAMVGTAVDGMAPLSGAGNATTVVEAAVVGEAEGDPVAVVSVTTTSGATHVRWNDGGRSDSMAPVDGYAALALPVSTAAVGHQAGTVTVTGAGGRVIATRPVLLVMVNAPSTVGPPVTGCPPTAARSGGPVMCAQGRSSVPPATACPQGGANTGGGCGPVTGGASTSPSARP